MNSALLLGNFEALVDGESSIKKLQDIVLQLAIQGKLVTQNPDDASVELLLKNVKAERNNLEKQKKIRKVKLSPINLDDDDLYELPNNWSWVKLGQIGDVFNGNSISKSEKEKRYTSLDDGYNYIATKDVDFTSRTIAYENGVKIPFEEEKFKIAHKGAVLICAEGGSAGKKIALTEQDICFGNKLYATESFSGIVPEYLFYVYQSPFFFNQFSNEMTGIIGGISINKFVDLYIPLPPSDEQNRIVEKIKELFDLLKKLKHKKEHNNQLKKQTVKSSLHSLVRSEVSPSFIHDNFNEFFADIESISDLRSTILQLAIQGNLSEKVYGDSSSFELIKNIGVKHADVSKQANTIRIPSHWSWVELGDIIDKERSISYGVIKLGKEVTEGIKTLRCSDVKFRYIDESSIKVISKKIADDYQRTYLRGGEILINIRGTLGGCAVVPPHMAGYNIAREVAVIPVHGKISKEYILNVLTSPFIQQETLNNLRGIAYKGLNLSLLSRFLIPLPPLEEQIRIVSKVDKLLALCDELEEQILQSQALNGNLMDSIIYHMMNAA